MKQSFAIILVALSTLAIGQSNTSSPYSIYGLGDPIQSQSTVMSSMGHANLAVINPIVINSTNPATFTDIKRPTFNMDMKDEVLTLSNGASSQTANAFSIQNFSFAFPIINDDKKFKRRAALSFGLNPLTSMGYNLSYSQQQSEVGQVDYILFGDGGINSTHLGVAIDLLANKERTNVLSAGVNGHYVFGQMAKNRATQFAPSAAASNLYRQSLLEVSGVDFSVGGTFKHTDTLHLNKTRADGSSYTEDMIVLLSVGGYFRPGLQLNSTSEYFAFTFSDSVTRPNPIDTLQSFSRNTPTTMPNSYGIGFSANFGNKWTLAADFNQTQWSKLSIADSNQNLKNSSRVGFGVEYLPRMDIKDADGKYLKTIRYRAGFSLQQSPFSQNGEQPLRYGINFGLGFPLTAASLSNSMFNIGVEAARRQTAGSALSENFINIHAGFIITPHVYDQWFAKRKYD